MTTLNERSAEKRFDLRNFAIFVAMIMGATAFGANAEAQSLPLNHFRQGETAHDDFAISRPIDLGNMQISAVGHLDYALNPLVVEQVQGDGSTEVASVVEHQLTLHVGFAVGLFDRLVLYAGLPIHLMQQGTNQALALGFAADGAGLGDAYFGGRLRLYGEIDDMFALAVQMSGTAASSQSQAFGGRDGGDPADPSSTTNRPALYSGDPDVTGHPELLMELRLLGQALRINTNLGVRVRAESSIPAANVTYDDEFTFGVGAAYTLWRGRDDVSRLDALGQVYGASSFSNFGGREVSPIEWLVGAKYYRKGGFTAGIAGGTGITRGFGAPDLRLLLNLGYQMPPRAPAAEPEPTPDEPTVLDSDGDGIPDERDAAPNDPEDFDGFEDEDGAPDPDNDQDGVPDADDAAPMDPEDMDGFQDEDGAPDLDNDGDGIDDVNDQCPTEAEDKDNVQDFDGCPETDADHDEILDADDHCPLTPGVLDTKKPEHSGCPAKAFLDERGSIQILEHVRFASGKAKILSASDKVLEDVLKIIVANEQVKSVRIEGHTDDRGKDAFNLDLSKKRAAAVRDWFIEHGVVGARLQAWGCGEVDPIEDNKTATGRKANRRVEFHIVDPHPEAGKTFNAQCVKAEDSKLKDAPAKDSSTKDESAKK